MAEIPLDDRGIAIERVLANARAKCDQSGSENVEALVLLIFTKHEGADCEFAGRPTVSMLAVAEFFSYVLTKIEPDALRRMRYFKMPLEECLIEIAKIGDADVTR